MGEGSAHELGRGVATILLAGVALALLLGLLYWVGMRTRKRAHLVTVPDGETLDARAEEARRR